jgi:hypothetical protein
MPPRGDPGGKGFPTTTSMAVLPATAIRGKMAALLGVGHDCHRAGRAFGTEDRFAGQWVSGHYRSALSAFERRKVVRCCGAVATPLMSLL